MNCYKCGNSIEHGNLFCDRCGTEIESDTITKICPICNQEYFAQGETFCRYDGTQLVQQYKNNTKIVRQTNSTIDPPKQLYEFIDEKANSNVLIQGLSGLLGFPFTLIADGAVILTHYAPMLNEIRTTYGRPYASDDEIVSIVKNIMGELIFDLANDKILGNIPLIGIYFNAICAKTMTWRLGILFSMMASRGEEIDECLIKKCLVLIRNVFPQSATYQFKQPDYNTFVKLLNSLHNNTYEEMNHKIDKALAAFL